MEEVFEDLGRSTAVPTTSSNSFVSAIEASISNIFVSSVIVATPDCDAALALSAMLYNIELQKSNCQKCQRQLLTF
jgi:hypothetical protein